MGWLVDIPPWKASGAVEVPWIWGIDFLGKGLRDTNREAAMRNNLFVLVHDLLFFKEYIQVSLSSPTGFCNWI